MAKVDWEQDWLRSREPVHLFARAGGLGIARTKAGRRRLRLLACALCRSAWDLFDEEGRAGVEAAEQFADGIIKEKDVDEANALAASRIRKLGAELPNPNDSSYGRKALPAVRLARAVFWATSRRNARRLAKNVDADVSAVCQVTHAVAASLIHCILGNPYRPIAIPRAVLIRNGGAVVKLARAIDEERRFQDMRILADALEEAGCDDVAVLAHCRGRGPHARGCHVLDAVLGRA